MSVAAVAVSVGGAAVAGWIDARTGRIPNAISRGTAVAAVLAATATGEMTAALWGAVVGGSTLLALYLVTLGTGIGLGDVKLAVAIGAGCGPSAAIAALGIAFVLGGAYATWLLSTRRARRGDAVRFAPFLAAGSALVAAAAMEIR
jgi:prepilin signal peptidase PulO-like enzyme (type II secretory pathway)